MMATVTLTKENFNDVVEGDAIVLIDFWASWCGPCRSFAPTYEQASARHPGVVFGKVDTEAEPELAAAFGITAIPTVAVIRDKVVLYKQPGALSGAVLDDLISQAEALDMEQVRAELRASGQFQEQ